MIRENNKDENTMSVQSSEDSQDKKGFDYGVIFRKTESFEDTTAEELKEVYMQHEINLEKKRGRRIKNLNYGSEPRHSKNSKDNKRIKIGRAFRKFISDFDFYFNLIKQKKSFKFDPVFLKANIYGVAKIKNLFELTLQEFLEIKKLNKIVIMNIKNNKKDYELIEEVLDTKLEDIYIYAFLPYFEKKEKSVNGDLSETAREMYDKYIAMKEKKTNQ